MHLARLNVWNEFVMMKTDTGVEPAGRKQTLLTALYWRYVRRVRADKLQVKKKAVSGVHVAEFDGGGIRNE